MAFDRKENAKQIMRRNIESDRVGRTLTPEAKERAVDFAVSVWSDQRGNGDAAKLGIKHVTHDMLKED